MTHSIVWRGSPISSSYTTGRFTSAAMTQSRGLSPASTCRSVARGAMRREPISLPFACPAPTLALGGQLKATFALGRGSHAFVSHHIGDLDHYEAFRAYTEAIAHYERLFAMRPEVLVHDLHDDYPSTRNAREMTPGRVPTFAVQHHHAHMASCMAENRLDEPVSA